MRSPFYCARVSVVRHRGFNRHADITGDQVSQDMPCRQSLRDIGITAVADIPFIAQRQYQRGKDRFVEELRRVDPVQYRQTLCQRPALFLQRAAVNRRLGAENENVIA